MSDMTPSRYVRRLMITVLVLTIFQSELSAATYYIDPNSRAAGRGLGTKARPFKQWKEFVVKSGNRYLQKRGTVAQGGILLKNVRNVTIGAYGEGPRPLLDGQEMVENGIKLVSTQNVTVSGLALRRYRGSCISIVGSADYLIEKNTCEQAKYGISINSGKFGPRGWIVGNKIRDTTGDGIGAWNLSPGPVIRDNRIHRFGNDGIDVLGSTNAVIVGNYVHESLDKVGIGSRGATHAGIKAGGNRGDGGGNNYVIGNIVRAVKNYGIYNRSAIGNVYIDNLCEGNGVNFNFVSPEGPSFAFITGNISRKPSYVAGLKYGVFIPDTKSLNYADGNQWYDGTINVMGVGQIFDPEVYKRKMYPNEINTIFLNTIGGIPKTKM